ncbi:MAG: hypothetical protein DI626_05500 [Micavibrio aeruginosavorus]|uniref:Lipoprotein n=1 Tax=Micavibrio aeruginosavorus TaxID=349221 RepID=A0A2W4ZWZ1_9BACT|nr:MAG: hypothetical protein DI626_05500 [Micavibrio aeruginosavorus]
MHKIISFGIMGLALTAGACTSPAVYMSDTDVISLSDEQLCDYNNNYRSESRTQAEIRRRDLNCNRHHRTCLKKGIQPNTEAMGFCEDMLRENERLRYDPPYDHFGMGLYGFSDYDRIRAVHRFR